MDSAEANKRSCITTIDKEFDETLDLGINSINFISNPLVTSNHLNFNYLNDGFTFTDVTCEALEITEQQLAALSSQSAAVHIAMHNRKVFSNPNVIGLDTLSELSIFKSHLMLETRACADLLVTGVNRSDKPLVINKRGTSVMGLDAYVSDQSVGNILSFADARDNSYSLQWNNVCDRFELQVFEGGETYMFTRHPESSSLYLCDLREAVVYVTTVTANQKFYSKREKVNANKARLLQRRLGFVSTQTLIKMINTGQLLNCEVTADDVRRAEQIYGQDLAEIKGKSTLTKTPALEVIRTTPTETEQQIAHVDIMFVAKKPFLITVFTETEYTMVTRIKSRHAKDIAPALSRHILEMRKQGFKTDIVRSDGEAGVITDAETNLQLLKLGITVDPCGPGEAIPRVERKIRVIKERARCLCASLPFRLARKLEDSAIIWAASRVNLQVTTNSEGVMSPREKVYGNKIDVRVDGKHGFGDYVQIVNPTTDNSIIMERTRGAIALLPTGNRDRSWYYMTLDNSNIVRRRTAKTLPMPDVVINRLNQLYQEDREKESKKANIEIPKNDWELQDYDDNSGFGSIDQPTVQPDIFQQGHQLLDDHPVDKEYTYEPEIDIMGDSIQSNVEALDQVYDEHASSDDIAEGGKETGSGLKTIIDHSNDDDRFTQDQYNIEDSGTNEHLHAKVLGDATNVDDIDSDRVHAVQSPTNHTSTGSDQLGVDIPKTGHHMELRPKRAQPGDFLSLLKGNIALLAQKQANPGKKNMTVRNALDKLGEEAEHSIRKEMSMVMIEKEAFKPIHTSSLTYEQKKTIIPSKMFLKEKYNALGVFEKLKSRLVAGGHRQDRDVFDSVSSATVGTSSVMMVSAIAAMEGRSAAVIDFPGAYLNSDLPANHPPVYMRLDKQLAKIACDLDNTYTQFIRDDGTVIVQLLKALYGCIQSSQVWYDLLTLRLGGIGYIKNAQDPCVFNKVNRKGNQVTIVIHVDDIMITTRGEDILTEEIKLISEKFGELTVSRGKKLNYLGMYFDYTTNGQVKITQDGFIADFLKDMEGIIDGVKDYPATKDLFKIGETNALEEDQKEFFHSTTARLLYLAKRCRPDILLSISYLVKRVQQPNQEDYNKLARVVKYLRGTSKMGIILQAEKLLHIVAYIDASHAVHDNHRSHSGTIISLGKGPIYQKSGSQRINTKSSTESEIVALSDNSSQVIWSRDFLISQGYQIEPALIYQDNTSTMSLVKNGKSNSERTKHISTRFYFIKDRVDNHEIRIEHLRTSEMIADILTKPITGSLFIKLRSLLMNWPQN